MLGFEIKTVYVSQMMNIEQIKSLVKKSESHRLEFKKSIASQSAAFKTLAAYLNCDGGTVLIGVTDDGNIVGQEITDKLQQALSHEISKIEPPAKVDVNYVPIEDTNRQVIVLKVKPGPKKPYVYDGRPYIREQTVTKQMPHQLYVQLVEDSLQFSPQWEKLVAEEYEIDDLDQDLLLGIVRKAVEIDLMPEHALRQTIPEILSALKLTTDNRVNNAAVVLFGKKMTIDFPQCQLKLARFKGTDRHEFIDSELHYGNIFELLGAGMKFVRSHLPIAAKIVDGQLERVETPLIPFDAIREALINALCHKDYTAYSGSIGLAIYDDRMEIFNNGGLMPGLSIEMLKHGHSEPRNPTISGVLHRGKLIEKWGRGIPDIISSCLKANDPEPEFIAEPRHFTVLFKFPRSIKPPVVEIGATPVRKDLTQRELMIIDVLARDGEMAVRHLMARIDPPVSIRTINYELSKLKGRGIVESKGETHSKVWFILKT